MSALSDTTLDASRVQIDLFRKKPPHERFELAERLTGEVIAMSKEAIRRRNPGWGEREVAIRFVELHYGRELAINLERYLTTVSSCQG